MLKGQILNWSSFFFQYFYTYCYKGGFSYLAWPKFQLMVSECVQLTLVSQNLKLHTALNTSVNLVTKNLSS